MPWDGNALRWRGLPSYQSPADLIEYARLIYEHRPDWVIETGSGEGGTTAFLMDVCYAYGHGTVLGVGADSLGFVERLKQREGPKMVILDSDVYSQDHMRAEIEAYAALVTSGQHLVVCHTDREDWGSAPALRAFQTEHEGEFLAAPSPRASMSSYLRRA